jgi:hypothetical protein
MSEITHHSNDRAAKPQASARLRPSRQKRPERRAFPSWKSLKTFSWRATAAYLWLRAGISVFIGIDTVRHLEHVVFGLLTWWFPATGLEPLNSTYLQPVLVGAWFLLITGLSATALIGMLLYVIVFPAFVVILAGYYGLRLSQAVPDSPQGNPSRGLISHVTTRPMSQLAVAALLSWFLLYGDTHSVAQLRLGVALSGVVLFLFSYRAFQRVRPFDYDPSKTPASPLSRLAVAMLKFAPSPDKRPWRTKADVIWFIPIAGLCHRAFRRVAIVLRGRRGQDRVSFFVLAEYVVSLILLGLSAVFFWSLVAKLVAAPSDLPFATALQVTASHFLPGVSTPAKETNLPQWLELGPAATAWILFVIYVGPAASILPARQEAYVKRVTGMYLIMRKSSRYYRTIRTRLRRVVDRLPHEELPPPVEKAAATLTNNDAAVEQAQSPTEPS